MPFHLKVGFVCGCALLGIAVCGLFVNQPEIGALIGLFMGIVLLITEPKYNC